MVLRLIIDNTLAALYLSGNILISKNCCNKHLSVICWLFKIKEMVIILYSTVEKYRCLSKITAKINIQ